MESGRDSCDSLIVLHRSLKDANLDDQSNFYFVSPGRERMRRSSEEWHGIRVRPVEAVFPILNLLVENSVIGQHRRFVMADGVDKTTERNRARNRARWFDHIRAWSGSGLSVAEYCRREGLQRNSFNRWRLVFGKSGEELASWGRPFGTWGRCGASTAGEVVCGGGGEVDIAACRGTGS